MLQVKHLTNDRLRDVSFELAAGQCMSITGRSGSGKSSLLRALVDLDPACGSVVLAGESRTSIPAPFWRQQVRYQAAEPAWWDFQTGTHFQAPADIDVGSLDLPDGIMEKPVDQLSTGERQRLALLRSLEGGPKLLALDEPTAALDPESQTLAEQIMRNHLEEGGMLILVSHDQDQAVRLADIQCRMEEGRLLHAD